MQKYKTRSEFMNDLDASRRLQVEMLRKIILQVKPEPEEHIKWNAPSYIFDGEDRITFNTMNRRGAVKLVLHMGSTRKENKKGMPIMQDESGLVEWSSDIRGVISFDSIEDIKSKAPLLKTIFEKWLSIPV